MNILHTSDLHLGKSLEGVSRIPEQKQFFEELYTICDNENIDVILIAGDIYDTKNPKALAEKLFYEALKKLSNNGQRLIVIIAGNHDSHERIMTSLPLVNELGVIIIGYPNTVIEPIKNDIYEVLESYEGCFKIKFKGEILNIIAMAYPSEQSLNVFFDENSENEFHQSYHNYLKSLFSDRAKIFKDTQINIVMTHLFLAGSTLDSSETDISLGGALRVSSDALPKCDYIALGHLHRSQEVKGETISYYSGSPIKYSFSECNHKKSVNVFSVNFIDGKKQIDIKKVPLTDYIPVEEWKVYSFDEAIEKCEENKDSNSYVHLIIVTDDILTREFIKTVKSLKTNILKIDLVKVADEHISSEITEDFEYIERSILEEFKLYYETEKNIPPSKEIIDMFIKIGVNENV